MTEEWKEIEGYEGLYLVSNLGRVKRSVNGKENFLTTTKMQTGYRKVILTRNGSTRNCTVHRLVAKAFVEGYQDGYTVNHIDENKDNNKAENLEWCSRIENALKYIENHKNEKRERKSIHRKPGPYKHFKRVIQYEKDGRELKVWNNLAEIERTTGKKQSSILRCCENKGQTAYGYKWRFE